MDRQTGMLLALGGLAALALSQTAGASLWENPADPSPPSIDPPDDQTAAAVANEIMDAPTLDNRVQAMLAAIRRFESAGQYDVLYKGGHFSDFSKFPYDAVSQGVPITLPGYEGKRSTAAGAYQINLKTYKDFAPPLGITDFSPASQDALALAILRDTGAYDALLSGDVAGAFALASKRWASLPGSTAGQNPQQMSTALTIFDQMRETFT